MISRRTAKIIAEIYERKFTGTKTDKWGVRSTEVRSAALYDYLYEHEYPAWFCNNAKNLSWKRDVQEFIMRLHTGETGFPDSQSWTWEQREKLGQRYLQELAEDFLNSYHEESADPMIGQVYKEHYGVEVAKLIKNLELDGFSYRNSKLLSPESDVLEVKEEEKVLKALYTSLGLINKETAFHHLSLSEEHYINSKWDDSISNSRKFLECVSSEVAAKYSTSVKDTTLPSNILERPAEVRNYLEREGLLEKKEREALAKVYALLSATGGHPYMAQNDQARLLRHMALTFCQFVMLRLDGRLKQNP